MTATMEPTTIPATTTATTGEVTVSGKGELTGMLADLALTASKDTTIPALTVIRLHTEGGRLHGWSTDRFRMAHAAIDVDGELPGVVYMEAADVKQLVTAMRTALVVTFRVDTEKARLGFGGDDGTNTVTFRSPDLDGYQLPDLGRVATDELPTGNAPVMFNGNYLADFGKVAKRRREYVTLVGNTENRPSNIRVGSDYRAWLMPMRQPESPVWLPSVF